MNVKTLSPVERWKSHVADSTWRISYKQHWNRFLEFTGATPEELVKLTQRDASDLAISYYNMLQNKGYSSKYCSTGYSAIRSFFAYNGIRLEKMSKKFAGRTQYKNYQALSPQDVFRMCEAIKNWRDKALFGIVFQGGQREGAAAALKVKHIATKDWEKAKVVVFDVPEFLPNVEGKNVNKRRIHYKFGVLDDVARYLKMHLDERRAKGEEITGESWLFVTNAATRRVDYEDGEIYPVEGQWANRVVKAAAKAVGLQTYVKTAIGKKRAQITAQSGRTYFKTQMRLAGTDPDIREFMIGHQMPYDGAYDRFGVAEIVQVLEKARTRLALTPEPADELEKRKQSFLDAARLLRGMMGEKQFKEFSVKLKKASTVKEVDAVIDTFKLGSVRN